MRALLQAAVALGAAAAAVAGAGPVTANVVDYGADPTGAKQSTTATEAALAAIGAGGDGGVLYFPPGTYLMTPFNVTVSNLVIQLEGATLRGSPAFDDWPIIAPLPSYGRGRDFPGPRYSPLVALWNVTNVRITSTGAGGANSVLDGQGAAWWAAVKKGSLTVTPGHLIEVLWSEGVEIDHVTLVDSPFWNMHLWASRGLHVHDVNISAPTHSTNTDGIDPDSASDVLIERVNINNGDDCIAIKSGWAPWAVWHEGQREGYSVPSNNITIRDMECTTQSACIAVGSEMSGGVSNVVASNINCSLAGQGLNVKSTLGRGGYITNVSFTDVTMGAVGTALAVDDGYRDQYPPAPVNATLVPVIAGVTIARVTASGPPGSIGSAGDFRGLAGAGVITGVSISDVDLTAGIKPGGRPAWACGNVTGSSTNVLPAPCAELQH